MNSTDNAKLDPEPLNTLSPRFSQAFTYAQQKHGGQRRKSSRTPYISHLMAVSGLVLEAGADEDIAIAALLHDVVEDCGGLPTLAEVLEQFGPVVAKIVEACSDNLGPEMPWRERKELYLTHLRNAPPDVRLVMAADKLHNVRTIAATYREIGEATWDRFHGGREGSLWYYRTMARELSRDNNRITQELERAVAELDDLAAERTKTMQPGVTSSGSR